MGQINSKKHIYKCHQLLVIYTNQRLFSSVSYVYVGQLPNIHYLEAISDKIKNLKIIKIKYVI